MESSGGITVGFQCTGKHVRSTNKFQAVTVLYTTFISESIIKDIKTKRNW